MFEFHHDRKRYYQIQTQVATTTIVPLVEQWCYSYSHRRPYYPRVLDVGCGEGGVLLAFERWGYKGVGVDTDESRIINGRKWHSIPLIHKDIFDCSEEELGGKFDIIIIKDVIEHISSKVSFLLYLSTLLNEGGKIFVAFPPWQMPFGGHQQMCSHFVSRLPWIHLLPKGIYENLLRNDPEKEQLMDIRDCRISIEEFETLCTNHKFSIVNKKHFLLQPIYQYKFGWKPREQFRFISLLPHIRNYLTTGVYYLISKK